MPTNEVKLLDCTLPEPAENLACDEVLLDWCEECGGEVLRFWEPAAWFVVLGYADRVGVEVNRAACAQQAVQVYRRSSGGGAVLQGPGCLNYSLVLQIEPAGPLSTITGANRFIMERHRAVLSDLLAGEARPSTPLSAGALAGPPGPAQVSGHTDLALGGRKFSGNAQRRRRRALLFHGTFLYDFNLLLMARFLNLPSRQPAYRQGRSHEAFVTNLPIPPARIKEGLREAWQATEPLQEWPAHAVSRLAAEKYQTEEWNLKF
jgi:lipoate---protein ligase